MTPQEKAKSLIDIFSPHAKDWDCFHDIPLDKNHAKECALIAVDELIRIAPWMGDIDGEIENDSKEYFIEVKQKIEKL